MSNVISFEGAMKKDFHLLHRVTQFDLHDESCAEEGGKWREANAAADAPDLYGSAPKVPRNRNPIRSVEDEFPWLWVAYGVALLATVAGCSLVRWATT
jgi:hypothetical protein